jgi:hypothetical protein
MHLPACHRARSAEKASAPPFPANNPAVLLAWGLPRRLWPAIEARKVSF